MSEQSPSPNQSPVAVGVEGFDSILEGGFAPYHLYLIEGEPGAGKTTIGLHFARRGASVGDRVLYVTLSETSDELAEAAHSHGWSLDGIDVTELVPPEESLGVEAQLTMFHASEVQLGQTTQAILAEVERVKPARVVIDSLSELRILAHDPARYRHQVLALKRLFAGRRCTVLLLDDGLTARTDLSVRSLVHGVVELEQPAPEFGTERRRLRVVKMRGRSYRGGHHDFRIGRGGLDVFPRLAVTGHSTAAPAEQVASGVPGLDALVGGGLDRGTSALLMGPAGSGKSSIALHYAVSAARRGHRALLFAFDESPRTLLIRAAALGMDLARHLESGHIILRQVDPAEMSPGEFAHAVSRAVGTGSEVARVVVIDSLNGYLHAMSEERFLMLQLHELLTYLGQQGVLTLLVVAQHGLVGTGLQAPVDASYLADAVILLRFFEAAGRLRRAVSVMKKRSGTHEDTIREFWMRPGGVTVGEPVVGFQGVLTGVPSLLQRDADLEGSE